MKQLVARLWGLVRGRRQKRPPAPSYRPRLESLEDRFLLATSFYQRTNLVSDQPGVAAIQDPTLINGWGIAIGPLTAWVSSNGGNVSEVYSGGVGAIPFQKNSLTVTIPGGKPTGQVFNGTSD